MFELLLKIFIITPGYTVVALGFTKAIDFFLQPDPVALLELFELRSVCSLLPKYT